MKCPKCKNIIPEKLLKCSHCGARIASLCKQCGAYNSIYNIKCVQCENELLKVCPSCTSINFPNAETCRKCGYDFLNPQPKQQPLKEAALEQKEAPTQESQIDYNANVYSQQKAKEALSLALTSNDKKIISLSGGKGIGKSIVLKSAVSDVHDHKMTWLAGECTAITQLSTCGLIQDILLSFFNVTNFCSDNLKLKKDSQRFFQNEFPTLTNEEIFNLLNFLYPSQTDYYENIINNKQKTFTFLEKIFKTIISNNRTIFVLENFEMIDAMSYEFLQKMLLSGFVENDFKIVLTYNEPRPARGYLYTHLIKDDSYLDITLGAFDKTQTTAFINQYIPTEKNCPEAITQKLYELSSGNPAVLEQTVQLLTDFEAKNNSFELELPQTINGVIKQRLELLKQENPLAVQVLLTATVSGMKFYPSILNQIFELSEADFILILDLLLKKNFIMQVNEFAYEFKSSLLWESIFEMAKAENNFAEINEKIFSIYSGYTLSSISLMAIIAQNLNQSSRAFDIWTTNIKLSAYIGDTNLYAMSQKQCLSIADKFDDENSHFIITNIYEQLGKLLSKSNPQEALEYLPTAITNAKKSGNTIKEIELTGYLASCCIALGDYFGTVECIDSVIERIDYSHDLELAMLKSRKLDALLNIGNSGQIINLIDNEIMPIFEKYINVKSHKNISRQSLYSAWLKTYLALANALILQGDNRSFEVLSALFEIMRKNEFDEQLFICKAKLAMAFANTIKGDIEASETILEEIIRLYKTDIMDNEAISRWNLINILNNLTQKKYSGLKEELFQVVTFANNVNDNFTKNILKTLLGKILKDEQNAKHALEIYSEQITYFAKEKNAIGALLTWYFIAEASLIVEGPEKSIEVAQKALDVAQSPKINNYFFIVLFNKVMAEAMMVKSEYEFAKVHIEKAIMVARKFELLDLLAQLYLLYGKYLQDVALIKSDVQTDCVIGASKMYKKATLVAQALKNNYILAKVEKSKAVLNSFCQLNGITLK